MTRLPLSIEDNLALWAVEGEAAVYFSQPTVGYLAGDVLRPYSPPPGACAARCGRIAVLAGVGVERQETGPIQCGRVARREAEGTYVCWLCADAMAEAE